MGDARLSESYLSVQANNLNNHDTDNSAMTNENTVQAQTSITDNQSMETKIPPLIVAEMPPTNRVSQMSSLFNGRASSSSSSRVSKGILRSEEANALGPFSAYYAASQDLRTWRTSA